MSDYGLRISQQMKQAIEQVLKAKGILLEDTGDRIKEVAILEYAHFVLRKHVEEVAGISLPAVFFHYEEGEQDLTDAIHYYSIREK